jgi:hypothetical protein
LFPFPISTPPASEGPVPDERGEFTPLASQPGADLDEWACFRGPGWEPVPSSYDWYGRLDPEGLVDDSDPLGRATGTTLPPAEAR